MTDTPLTLRALERIERAERLPARHQLVLLRAAWALDHREPDGYVTVSQVARLVFVKHRDALTVCRELERDHLLAVVKVGAAFTLEAGPALLHPVPTDGAVIRAKFSPLPGAVLVSDPEPAA